MFPSANILLSLLLVSVAFASPVIQRGSNPVTLEFAHHVKALNGTKNLAQIDRARAKKLVNNVSAASGKVTSVDVSNAVVSYTTQIGVGSPPTQCEYAK
jgi:saccharopepsin